MAKKSSDWVLLLLLLFHALQMWGSVANAATLAAAATTTRTARAVTEETNHHHRRVSSWLNNNNNMAVPDLSDYYLQFQSCQSVQSYSDELAAQHENSKTVWGLQHFLLFRLCPGGSSSSSSSSSLCNYNYGEYVMPLERYLETTVEYLQKRQEERCDACTDNSDEDCYDECQKIENMEENGYIDATEFLECQMIYDPEDDNVSALYAGPICAGEKLKIGVFLDEDCNILDPTRQVDDYLMNGDGYMMKLSYFLLKQTYQRQDHDSAPGTVSCLDKEEEELSSGGGGEAKETCWRLYEDAAKCESEHGFAGFHGSMMVTMDDDDKGPSASHSEPASSSSSSSYRNQREDELVVCDYISSLRSGTYSEEGQILVRGQGTTLVIVTPSRVTGAQWLTLLFLLVGTLGLALYSAKLTRRLQHLEELEDGEAASALAMKTGSSQRPYYELVQMNELELSTFVEEEEEE